MIPTLPDVGTSTFSTAEIGGQRWELTAKGRDLYLHEIATDQKLVFDLDDHPLHMIASILGKVAEQTRAYSTK